MSKAVYISAGHSGTDVGAVKYVTERDEVWEISNYVAEELNKLGIPAYRDKWGYSWKDTVDEANRLSVDLFVEIHENAGRGDGAEVIIYNSGRQYIADRFKTAFADAGQNWRRTIIDPSFWVLKYTNMPATILEVAFVDNLEDIKDFDEPHEKRNLAVHLAKAIADLIGVSTAKAESKPATPQRAQEAQIEVDGVWGRATTLATQKKLNTGYIDGMLSNQNRQLKEAYLWNAHASGWEFSGGTGGSNTVRAIQRLVGATTDGIMGKETVRAMQKFLGITADGIMGKETVKAWQRYLNSI